MPKPKKISYKPPVKALTKRLSVQAAMAPEIIRTEDLRRRAMRMHLKGRDHDYIARRLGITTNEAHDLIKSKIQQYLSSESYDPNEMKAIIAQRYDVALSLAVKEAMPHPILDEAGRPVMVNACDCELDDGVLCSIDGHLTVKMSRPDAAWLRIYLEVLGEQKKMYGIDAADKMRQQIVDKLERTYKGVDQKTIDAL
jgi:hypothetical protein